jgi:MFS family permease
MTSSLVGRVSSGYLADIFGRFNVFIVCCLISGILALGMWIPIDTYAVTAAFAVLFGVFSGAYISLLAALIAQVSPLEEIGYRNGLSSFFSSISGLVSGPIAGVILERPGGVTGLKVFAGILMIAGTMGVIVSRLVVTKFKLNAVF